MRATSIREFSAVGFRNLRVPRLVLGASLNVVAGANGHGKTSLIEAIYFAATSKSFRTPRIRELVQHGANEAAVRIRVVEPSMPTRTPEGRTNRHAVPAPDPQRGEQGQEHDTPRTDADPDSVGDERIQTATIRGGRVRVRIDDHAPASLTQFATRTPIVVFHPEELQLSAGPSSLRRKLLDRLLFHADPLGAQAVLRHGRALRERQALLRQGHLEGAALDAYEEICAIEGARATLARRRAATLLLAPTLAAFRDIAAPDLQLSLRHHEGGSDDPLVAARDLRDHRVRDAHRSSATTGPHRDDLALELDGRPVRAVASQGQHRAIVLALKAAERRVVAEATQRTPILLLDDVSSELDPARNQALFRFLTTAPIDRGAPHDPTSPLGQIVVTTTRPDLVPKDLAAASSRCDFSLQNGAVTTLGELADSQLQA